MYKILEKILDINYKLKLSKKSRLYLIFYVSLLELAAKNTLLKELNIKDTNKADIYNIKRILDSRISIKIKKVEYLIK